jgi:drug/metabolite transporter (DMT)-like permease
MISVLLGLGGATAWAIHDLLARSYTPKLGPIRMSVLILLLGFVLLLPVVLWRQRLGVIDGSNIWSVAGTVLVFGIVYALALYNLLKSFAAAPVSVVGPLTAGYPVLVVIWGLFNGLAPKPLEWLAVALVLLGAIMVARLGPKDGGMALVAPEKRAGVLWTCVLASVGFAAAIILGQKLSETVGTYEATFLSRIPAALVLLPFVARGAAKIQWSRATVVAACVMAVCDVTAVTSINMMADYPNKEYGAMAVASYGAIAAVLAAVVLKERVASGQWIGIVVIASGIAIFAQQ